MTAETPRNQSVDAGVIGVGSMGRHHARVYSELTDADLVGVSDLDTVQARSVADEFGTRARSRTELLETADVVSVAVPTEYHYETVTECIEHDVHVLVEKPFVEHVERGEELADLAAQAGLTLQVGHVERFNPATRVLADLVPDLDLVAIDVDRLGPPLNRENNDSVVMDMMVHDIDILLALVDSDVTSFSTAAKDERHVTAQLQFEDGCIAALTASRLTQQKVRTLSLTAMSCRVNVDFISQTVEIHRRSLPEYVEDDGDIRYQHESVVERPMVENGEPLKHELESFIEAVVEGTEPVVTPTDGLQVIRWAEDIERQALRQKSEVTPT
jgi:predicted dehydrogenase